MKTIRYEVQASVAGVWFVDSTSNPTPEGLAYAMDQARKATEAGNTMRVIEIQEQEKLLWPDVGNCG